MQKSAKEQSEADEKFYDRVKSGELKEDELSDDEKERLDRIRKKHYLLKLHREELAKARALKDKQANQGRKKSRKGSSNNSSPTPGPSATSRIWDGGGADANWTSDNWTTGVPNPGDSLIFDGTTRTANTNNFTAGTAFSGLSFASGAGAFVLSGNSIKLAGSILNNSSSKQSIELPITLNGNITLGTGAPISTGVPDIFLNGNVNLNGATRTFTGVRSAGQVHFGAGGISGGSNGVNFATTFTATGDYVPFIFEPTNTNTYTGLTTVSNGAFLVFEGTTDNGAIHGDVLITGNGVVDYLGGVPGASEQIADTATVTVNSAGNNAAGSSFAGFDLFQAEGTETIGTLNGSGTVGLSNSTLAVGAGTFTGVISDGPHGGASVGGKLTKYGAGVLTLSGANTFTGGMTLSAGTLNINNASAIGASVATFTIAGGTIDNTTASPITLSTNNAQNWNGNFTFSGTSALNLGTGAVTMNSTRTVTVNGSGALTVGGVISGPGFGLTKAGAGTLILNGANLYNGTTTINAGTLKLGSATAISATLVFGSGSTGRLQLNGNNITVTSLNTNATVGSPVINSGSVTPGTDTLTLNASAANTYGGTLADGSTRSLALTLTGSGSLALTGNNTYTGATTVSGGNLRVGVGGVGTTGTGATTVDAGAKLSGTGTVNGTDAVTAHVLNGTLDPGDSGGAGTKGTLTIKGNLTATSATSLLNFDITDPTGTYSTGPLSDLNIKGGITPEYTAALNNIATTFGTMAQAAGAHDRLVVNGILTIDGNTTINVNDVGASLTTGQVFNIIDAISISASGFDTGGDQRDGGTIVGSGLILPTLAASYLWDTTKFVSHGLLVVVDPPVYWTGGATGDADPTSWTEAGNWVRANGAAAVAPDATAEVVISYSGGASHQNAMQLNQDLAIRELTINDANETSLSGTGTLKIAPVVDNGEDHDAITVNSGAGMATINTGLRLSQDARITVNNVDTDAKRGGLVLRGQISAKKKLIKSGPGRLTFQDASMAIGDLHGTAAETLNIQFEGSGGITMQDTTLQLDLFSNGSADKILFTGSLEGGNDVLLQDTHFDVAAADGAQLNSGESWDILDWENMAVFEMRFTGDIANFFNLPTLGEGQSWGLDRFATEGVIYVTPEPSRAVLMLVAFALIHFRRRRG